MKYIMGRLVSFHCKCFSDLIEKIGESFQCEDLEGQLWKVDPNEIGSLDCFAFVRWYVDLVEVPDGDKLE